MHHLVEETVSTCPKCEQEEALVKMVTSFRTTPSVPVAAPTKTGTVTEEFIKDAREDLKKQKRVLEDQS